MVYIEQITLTPKVIVQKVKEKNFDKNTQFQVEEKICEISTSIEAFYSAFKGEKWTIDSTGKLHKAH